MRGTKKIKYPRVKITWWDITSSTDAWVSEKDIEDNDISICEDVGYLYKKTRDRLWLFTSYSEDENGMDVGGLTCFPRGCVKKIEVIK
nr:hypothetical protein [uncultured Mediterranean phage uvMED]